jgi:hypothetical protein
MHPIIRSQSVPVVLIKQVRIPDYVACTITVDSIQVAWCLLEAVGYKWLSGLWMADQICIFSVMISGNILFTCVLILYYNYDRTSTACNENFIITSKIIIITDFLKLHTLKMSCKIKDLSQYLHHNERFLTSCNLSVTFYTNCTCNFAFEAINSWQSVRDIINPPSVASP